MKNAMRILKCAKPKKGTPDDSSRERLLQTAAKLFAVNGYDRVSIRDITKDSKCNLSMVSYYFGGKEKLYQQIFENFFERVQAHMSEIDSQNNSGSGPFTKRQFLDEVRASLRFMLSEYENDPFVKVVFHREAMDGFPRVKDLFDRHMATLKERISGLYLKAQKAGFIRPEIHAPTFAMLLNRGVEAYIVAYMFAQPVRDIGIDPLKQSDRFLEQINEIFFKGALT